MSRRSITSTALALLVLGAAGVGSFTLGQNNEPLNVSSLAPQGGIESTSLYCFGLSPAGQSGSGAARFWNTSDSSRRLTIEMADDRSSTTSRATIKPHQTLDVPVGSHYRDSVAIRAQIDGGGVVGSVYTTSEDSTSIPCRSEGVTDWYVSGIGTSGSLTSRITLLNPSATPAVIDVNTWSSQGYLAPADYQGLVIPSNGQITLRLADVVVDASQLAVHVTALRGSFLGMALATVGSKTSLISGQNGVVTEAIFGSVNTNDHATEIINLFNPLETSSKVTLRLQLPGYTIAPITTSLEPGTTSSITLVPATRVPAAGWGTLRVSSEAGIVATLYSDTAGYSRLESPTDSGTTLAWNGAQSLKEALRVSVLSGQRVPVTFTYFDRGQTHSVVVRASVGAPVAPPEAWVAAGQGLISSTVPLVAQGSVAGNGLESALNGR